MAAILKSQLVLMEIYCDQYINDQISDVNVLRSKNMDIYLENITLKCGINETLTESIDIRYHIQMYIGFEIKKSKLLSIENYKRKLDPINFDFEFCYFQFYKETYDNKNRKRHLKLLNESSSFDLLKNYHDLNDLNNDKNISFLYEHFTSLFTKYKTDITFKANTFIKNKLSRLLFKDSFIYKLYYDVFTNTSMRKHFFEFNQDDDLFEFMNNYKETNSMALDLNKTQVYLNSNIEILQLYDIYNLKLTEALIDKYVYKRTKQFIIDGTFLNINDFTFKTFKYLSEIKLVFRNPKEFWHNSADHKWLSYINSIHSHKFTIKNKTKISQKIIDWYDNHKILLYITDYYYDYKYPNEDICLFRNFPHKNTVLFSPERTEWDEASDKEFVFNVKTCTTLHLSRYSFLFKQMGYDESFSGRFVYDQTLFQSCNLDALLLNCSFKNDSFHFKKITEINLEDFIDSLGWIELIGPIITFPIVCFIGILTNILVIITIKSEKSKSYFTKTENQTRMFNFLVINATFNIIECAVSSFTLMSECLGLETVFCSRIQLYDEVQYFKIYFVGYFGEIMKTCSVIFTLLFSLERYKITLESENKILVKLSEIKLRIIILATIVVSASTSFGKIFEYDTLVSYSTQMEYPRLNLFQLFVEEKYFEIVSHISHYIINDFFLLIYNFIIDILLVKKIREDLKHKKHFLHENFNKNASSNNENSILKQKLDDNLNDIKKAERGTNKLIIYSLILYCFCRFPELGFYLYLLFADQEQHFIIGSFGPLMINLVEYLYVVSYSFNLFFYFKFNKNFRDAFKNIFFKTKKKENKQK